MVYCNMENQDSVIHVSGLFGQAGVNYNLGFAQAWNQSIKIPNSSGKIATTDLQIGKDEWKFGLVCEKGVSFTALTCCAAVLIYTEDIIFKNLKLFAVGHPKGGIIKKEDISFIKKNDYDEMSILNEKIVYAVYATKSLKENTPAYESSIEALASRCGTDKLCVIDGFKNLSVFANMIGNIYI